MQPPRSRGLPGAAAAWARSGNALPNKVAVAYQALRQNPVDGPVWLWLAGHYLQRAVQHPAGAVLRHAAHQPGAVAAGDAGLPFVRR